jgi:SAM-dependent methyltransferase
MPDGTPELSTTTSASPADPILDEVRRFYEGRHEEIQRSRRRHAYYYAYLERVLRVRVPEGLRILDLGGGAGDLLAGLKPSYGVGVDVSARAVDAARARHPDPALRFLQGDFSDPAVLASTGGPFDVILLVNVVTHLTDVQATLERLHAVSHSQTRVMIYSYSRLWQPVLRLAEILGLKHRQPSESWLPPEEIKNMLSLADFDVVRDDAHVVFPVGVPLLANLLNRYVGRIPPLDALSLVFGIVARPAPARWPASRPRHPTVSVVIPCRNEAGHVPTLVGSLPALPEGSEFLFVEGNSTDDTEAVIRREVEGRPELPLRLLKQRGRGKGDAVRLGFAEAKGDVVLILDSDMGVAPADVPKFVEALARGKGEMVNGSRLVYPMEGRAMRFLNLLANKTFAFLFTWILGQQVRDTLCGTKALWRADYERIAANRSYFGDFDPFGDFDLLFGAARLNMRIVDLAVRYHERRYGETNISRFRHGWLLLQMSAFAARKLKFL